MRQAVTAEEQMRQLRRIGFYVIALALAIGFTAGMAVALLIFAA